MVLIAWCSLLEHRAQDAVQYSNVCKLDVITHCETLSSYQSSESSESVQVRFFFVAKLCGLCVCGVGWGGVGWGELGIGGCMQCPVMYW